MTQNNTNVQIRCKEFLTDEEFAEIMELQELCFKKDHINLKLEVDYKLHVGKTTTDRTDKANEFLYYIDKALVAYLGICCFGSNIGEINGMTHPDFRKRGIFTELFKLTIKEALSRNFSKILLLSDAASSSGVKFIELVGGKYNNSEYRMTKVMSSNPSSAQEEHTSYEGTKCPIALKVARKRDQRELDKLNSIFFGDEDPIYDSVENVEGDRAQKTIRTDIVENKEDFSPDVPLEELNTTIYMVELENNVIGKINIEYTDHDAFIFGFGILPDFRGQGYGRATLQEALWLIAERNISSTGLDVVCTNSRALNLYKSLGFEEQSVMNYYQYH
ncbi:MAG: GNAT family N-acetyltransferase [Mobilitalea sp.]